MGELHLGVGEQADGPGDLLLGNLHAEQVDPQSDQPGLAHRFDQDHSRGHRVAGEVALVKSLVLAEGVLADRGRLPELDEAVDEAERPLLRDQGEHLLRGQHQTLRSMMPPTLFAERSG